MAGWKEIIFKGVSVADLDLTGIAQGDMLVAGATTFKFAPLTKGSSGDVLTAGASTVSWVAPTIYSPRSGTGQGSILLSGTTPFHYAELTKGADGKYLKAGASTISWETPSIAKLEDIGDVEAYTGEGGKVLAVNAGGTDVEWISAAAGDFKADGTVPMTGNLDFANHTAKDMKLHTTVPTTPADGHMYFDTAADKVKVYVA